MFSYTDSVFQASNSPTKELKFDDLQQRQHQHQYQSTITTNSYATNNGPLYPYNDMIYSGNYQQQQMPSTYDVPSQHPQRHTTSHQQRWQELSSQQHPIHNSSNSFYPDIRNQPQSQSQSQLVIDHSSSYDHYNTTSPFSSPIPNSNVLMGSNTTASQRSSLQSLPSVPPIPSSNATSPSPSQRPRITTSLWDDEGTVCYQVDVRGICVARRQGMNLLLFLPFFLLINYNLDNDMVNGTKLLNVTGMSRGKRDGILKNEKGRVVVKVGAMHLKGVW